MSGPYDFRFILGPHSEVSLPLQKLLIRNSKLLNDVGAEFPPVKQHREEMSKVLKRSPLELASPKTLENFAASVLQRPDSDCIIYNYDAFFGSRKNALVNGVFYPNLENKVFPLRQLTQGQNVTLILTLQHVAQFIDKELKDVPDLRKDLSSNPGDFNFSWLMFVWRIREAWPEVKILIWDIDDLAVNWPIFVALTSGYPMTLKFRGIEKYTTSCLAEDGRKPFLTSLRSNPPKNMAEWLDRTSKYFLNYGRHIPIIEKIFVSPWSPEQIQTSKNRFKVDMKNCRNLKNVFLAQDLELETL